MASWAEPRDLPARLRPGRAAAPRLLGGADRDVGAAARLRGRARARRRPSLVGRPQGLRGRLARLHHRVVLRAVRGRARTSRASWSPTRSSCGTEIEGADAAGLQVIVHAIGDRANDWLLDVYREAAEQNGPRDRRFRIEHAQHLTPPAIGRFAEQGVIASMQPYHAADDGRWAEKRIGPERIRTTYAFRSLLDAGATLAFGSDWTVAPHRPDSGDRRGGDPPHDRRGQPGRLDAPGAHLPGGDAPAYTAGGAAAGFEEDRLGSCGPGCWPTWWSCRTTSSRSIRRAWSTCA